MVWKCVEAFLYKMMNNIHGAQQPVTGNQCLTSGNKQATYVVICSVEAFHYKMMKNIHGVQQPVLENRKRTGHLCSVEALIADTALGSVGLAPIHFLGISQQAT